VGVGSAACHVLRITRDALGTMAVEAPGALHVLQVCAALRPTGHIAIRWTFAVANVLCSCPAFEVQHGCKLQPLLRCPA